MAGAVSGACIYTGGESTFPRTVSPDHGPPSPRLPGRGFPPDAAAGPLLYYHPKRQSPHKNVLFHERFHMFIYMYMYIFIYMYIYMCVCVCVCMFMNGVYVCVCMCVYVYVCVCVCVCVFVMSAI